MYKFLLKPYKCFVHGYTIFVDLLDKTKAILVFMYAH